MRNLIICFLGDSDRERTELALRALPVRGRGVTSASPDASGDEGHDL